VNEDMKDPGYPTALFAAAGQGSAETVRVLLEAGADASVVNGVGRTAADLAARLKKDDVVAVFNEFASKKPGMVPFCARFCSLRIP
jgi:ankyrin repeat protein